MQNLKKIALKLKVWLWIGNVDIPICTETFKNFQICSIKFLVFKILEFYIIIIITFQYLQCMALNYLNLIDFLDRSDTGRVNCFEIGDWCIRVREQWFIYSILCYNHHKRITKFYKSF